MAIRKPRGAARCWGTGRAGKLFIKCAPERCPLRLFAGTLRAAEAEVVFYSTHAKDAAQFPIPVPRCYYAEKRGARSLVVLDDLLAKGARMGKTGQTLSVAESHRFVTTTLAPLHARFWGAPLDGIMRKDLRHKLRDYTAPAFLFYLAARGAKRRPDIMPPGSTMDRICDFISEHGVGKVYATMADDGPLTLMHGDAHTGNTFCTKDGEMGLVDWQAWGVGSGLFDVTELISISLPPQELIACERELLAAYCDRLRALSVKDFPVEVALSKYPLFAMYPAMMALLALGLGMANKPATLTIFRQLWHRASILAERLRPLEMMQARWSGRE
jgi:hypothetical protein